MTCQYLQKFRILTLYNFTSYSADLSHVFVVKTWPQVCKNREVFSLLGLKNNQRSYGSVAKMTHMDLKDY